MNCRTPPQNYFGSGEKLFCGEIFQTDEEGEDISTVIDMEPPSLKGQSIFNSRHGISSA